MRFFKIFLAGQILWFVAASTYNFLSMRAVMAGQKGWAGDTPVQAEIFVLLFGLIILTGFLKSKTIYRFGLPIVLLMLVVGGVIRHLQAPPEAYASSAHWIWAIGINLFGSVMLFCGVATIWRRGPTI